MTIPDGTKLEIAWHKDTIGVLTMQDAKWHWQSANTKEARIFEGSAPGTMPALLKNLMPEGWLAKILHDNNKRDSYLSEGIRFLSNITIATDSDVMGNVPFDRLQATVDDFKTEDGLFSGTYNGPTAPEVDENFQKQLAAHWQNRCMPKFSGVQMKMPMTLYDCGTLTPAHNEPFTHFLKLPGSGFFESLGAAEWMALELAERAGLPTAKHALVDMPEGMAPAVLVERFDIPQNETDTQDKILISDFCNLGRCNPITEKYGKTIEDCAKILEASSTDFEQDKELFFRRNIFAWAILDCDMHTKNISMLRRYNPETGEFSSRFSPAYDPITTVIFPTANRRHLALKIGGRTSEFKMDTFMKFARTLKLDEDRAKEIVNEVVDAVTTGAAEIAANPPEAVQKHENVAFALKNIATEIIDQATAFGAEVPEWEPVRTTKAQRKAFKLQERYGNFKGLQQT